MNHSLANKPSIKVRSGSASLINKVRRCASRSKRLVSPQSTLTSFFILSMVLFCISWPVQLRTGAAVNRSADKPLMEEKSLRNDNAERAPLNHSEAAIKSRLRTALAHHPLYFTENRGQLDHRVNFYLAGQDTSLLH